MAISTYQAFLMKGTGSTPTYAKLVDIKSFGDLGGVPESLETTTLTNGNRTYIAGIQDSEAIEFTANYTAADFTTVKALQGTGAVDFAVWFGATSGGVPDGHNGKFSFKGELSVYVPGGGVNEVVDMTITILPTTDITFAAS